MSARWKASRARRWLQGCAHVGESPVITGRPSVHGEEGQLRIGDRFRLASIPVPSHLVAGPGAILDIGDDVAIGCGAAISAHERVQIGSGTRIGPYVIIMDSNFHGSPGDQSLHHDCRPVRIGAGCRIGSRVTITRGATIGDGAEILAGSVVSTAIPPGVCAAGASARIIGKAGDLQARWESPAAALPAMLMASLGLESPPNLDATVIPDHLRSGGGMEELGQSLKDQFGIAPDPAAIREARTFADIAAVVREVRPRSI